MRKQYFFRRSARGYDAWDVDRLIELSRAFPIREVPLTEIRELDEPFALEGSGDVPTGREVAFHARLIGQADAGFPIILSASGRVMDGMHRVMRALIEERSSIRAVAFSEDPPPDHVGVLPDELPYERPTVLGEGRAVRGEPVPKGIPPLIPMLVCRDAGAEMAFCTTVFAAEELNRRLAPDGSIAHGLVRIGDALVMIEGEWPGIASRPPDPDGSSGVVLYVYVADVDAAVHRAIAAGAALLMPVEDRFWGDRTGRVMDPSGHVWTVASRIEETTAAERAARWSGITSA